MEININEHDRFVWETTSLYDFLYKYNQVPIGYRDFFNNEDTKSIMKTISFEISRNVKDHLIFPYLEDVFKALYYTPNPRVVILGLDPYATLTSTNNPSARGLCFSVTDRNLNPSLRNIQKEVANCGFKVDFSSGDLSEWTKQGVLLLNTSLTVRIGESGCHTGIWEPFTSRLVTYLCNKYELVWLLHGKNAQEMAKYMTNGSQKIIRTSHPVPYTATVPYRDTPAFIGSKCYIVCNTHLKNPIDFSINK